MRRLITNEAALADKIVEICGRGTLPTPFGVSDVRKHFGGYAPTYIRVVLSNYCETSGNVKRGQIRTLPGSGAD